MAPHLVVAEDEVLPGSVGADAESCSHAPTAEQPVAGAEVELVVEVVGAVVGQRLWLLPLSAERWNSPRSAARR